TCVELPEAEIRRTSVRRIRSERVHRRQSTAASGIISSPEPEIWPVVDKKPTGFYSPIRLAGRTEIHTFRDASPQRLPSCTNVAVPCECSVAMLAGIGRACEIQHTFDITHAALAFID